MSEAIEQLGLFDFEESIPSNLVVETPTVSLLDKFSSIDISVDQRISEFEAEYCKRQEMIFYESRDLLKKHLEEMIILAEKYSGKDSYRGDLEERFINEYDDINRCKNRITSIYEGFIDRITGFFVRRHKVTLSSSKIKEKYDENLISYSIILDEIFEQLGGFSFKEKAVEEIKAASRDVVYKKTNIKITKNKLSVTDCVWWSSYSYNGSTELSYDDRRVRPLFLALSHFMNGSVEMSNCLSQIYHELRRGSNDYDIFLKYEIGINNVESFKVFKNGKIELVFSDHENAEAFKNEYLI